MNKTLVITTICVLLSVLILIMISPITISKISTKRVKGDSTQNLLGGFNPVKLPTKKDNFSPAVVNVKANLLLDIDSFYVLHEDKANTELPIASTTKMATAIVVMENYSERLQDLVTITPKMINVEGSDIQLRPGEKITVENLLKGLLIMSGNDAAYSLAEYFGGKEKFVDEMNSKVLQIGAKNTLYKDPAGLNDEGYSTAHDLAVIAAYGLRIPMFKEIVKIPETEISSSDGLTKHKLINSNRMLRQEESNYYPFAIGIKTGFTYAAGHVLVSAAEKDGHRLLSVILNTYEDTTVASAKESRRYLDWGFNNWQW